MTSPLPLLHLDLQLAPLAGPGVAAGGAAGGAVADKAPDAAAAGGTVCWLAPGGPSLVEWPSVRWIAQDRLSSSERLVLLVWC